MLACPLPGSDCSAVTLGLCPRPGGFPWAICPGHCAKWLPTIPGATVQEEPPGGRWLERENVSFGEDFAFGKLRQVLSLTLTPVLSFEAISGIFWRSLSENQVCHQCNGVEEKKLKKMLGQSDHILSVILCGWHHKPRHHHMPTAVVHTN